MRELTEVEQTLAGSVAYFWPSLRGIAKVGKHSERGFIREEGDGWLTVETLDEGTTSGFETHGSKGSPESMLGLSAHSALLLLEVQWRGHSARSNRASTTRYRARTLITHVPLQRLRSFNLSRVEAHFPGVDRWAGITAVSEHPEKHDDGRIKTFSLRVESPPERTYPLSRGRKLTLSATWEVSGRADHRILRSPVSVACSSNRPRTPWELLQPLLLVQDALSLAYGGFVAAEDGRAVLDVAPLDGQWPEERPRYWNGALMRPSVGVSKPKSMGEVPLFHLATIGGLPGLARWVRLAEKHHRATAPIVYPYRLGLPTADGLLREVANGIEYWVRVNRPAAWASGKHYPDALAARVGDSFSQWVGDPQKWAKEFADSNNFIKHEPTYQLNPDEISDVGVAGRLLLTAALLDRAAGSKRPSTALFQSHRIYSLGGRLRNRYK